jgi:NAD(P)H-dependent flavin oxidoreductase YrpB (nitropropane dioxygenase family)
VQTHILPSLYGAMLAGVDYVLMGAGIPRDVPGALDKLAANETASIKLDVAGLEAGENSPSLTLDPREVLGDDLPTVTRPRFLPIIASNLLATIMARKATGSIEGFIIEGPTAGGHNAPPRGAVNLDELGQPIYGEKDVVRLDQIREIGLPFWLAGGSGSPEALSTAQEAGAAGIQVGTLFSMCEESGFAPEYKEEIIARTIAGETTVRTDPRASPTGFPFKVVNAPTSLAAEEHYAARERVCDLGYLREPYKRQDGSLGFRCAAEPENAFLSKGGKEEETAGRKCLCNALLASAGFGQYRKDGRREKPLFTSGDDLVNLGRFLGDKARSYKASEVIDYLLGRRPTLA